MDDLWLDIRFAWRTFAKAPGFVAVAVLTLAMGIGATTAVFSIVNAVLLRPLPYSDPNRLVAIWITSNREKGLAKLFATHEDFAEFRRNSRTLESAGEATWAKGAGSVLTGYGPARPVLTIPAGVSFFETLGVTAAVGRTFRSEDERHGCSVLLAHSFWTAVFGSDPAIAGKSLTLDEKPCQVVGVMPESFAFYPRQTQAWVLLGPNDSPDQAQMLVGIFARLKPGVTLPQVQAELTGIYRAIHKDRRQLDFEPVVHDLHGEFTFLAGRTLRTTLLLVFAAVLLVLLTACLNVANLLLARVSDRAREMAVRAALGSGQGRLIRQVLTEGVLLSTAGAGLGVGMAWAALRYFRQANPIELSVGADAGIHLPVLVFGIALSFVTTVAFGLLPAFRASKVDLTRHLKAGGRGSIQGRHGLAKTLIAVEMALSFLLLAGAGLFMGSALRMGSEPLGFDPDGLLSTRITLPASHYSTNPQRLRIYDQLLERFERMPGLTGAALASKVPPEAGGNQTLEIQGRPVAEGHELHDAGADAVSPGFFDALRIPLRRGRLFTRQDRDSSQPVVIINDAMATKYFAKTEPLGQQIRLAGGPMPWLTVVGVVGNLKHTELMNEMTWVETPILYRPLAQEPRSSVQVALRTASGAANLALEIQRQIAAVDPAIPSSDIETFHSRLGKTLAYPRFRGMVFTFFALGALLLSAVGLQGVLAQLVAQRTPEFGIRRAIGAQTLDVLWLVARQGGTPVAAGLSAGVLMTIASSRVLTNLLYGLQPADPKALMLVSLVLLAVAVLAIALPALRAARIDPMAALREE